MGRKPPEEDKLSLWQDLDLCRLLAPNRSLLELMSLEPQVLLSLTWDDADSVIHWVDRRDNRPGVWGNELDFSLGCDAPTLNGENEEVWPGSDPDALLAGEAGFHGIDESLAASDAAADLTIGITTDDDSGDLTEGLDQVLSSDRQPKAVCEDDVSDRDENFVLGWRHLTSHLWSDTVATAPLGTTAVGPYGVFVLGDFGLLFDVGLLGGEPNDEGIDVGTEYLVTINIECSAIVTTWSMGHDGQTDPYLLVDINLEAFDPHLIAKVTVRIRDQHAMSINGEQEVARSIDDATGMAINTGIGMPVDLVYLDNTPLGDDTLPLESDLSSTGLAHYQVGEQMGEIDFTGPIDLFAAA